MVQRCTTLLRFDNAGSVELEDLRVSFYAYGDRLLDTSSSHGISTIGFDIDILGGFECHFAGIEFAFTVSSSILVILCQFNSIFDDVRKGGREVSSIAA